MEFQLNPMAVLPILLLLVTTPCFTTQQSSLLSAQASPNSESKKERILLGYLPAVRGTFPGRQGIDISGAITLAIERINNRSDLLPNVELDLIWGDTEGDTLKGTEILVNMLINDTAAFFGPESSCSAEATVAGAMNRAMISYFCADGSLSDKERYPTFVRTASPDTQIVQSVLSLLSHYNWKIFQIILQSSHRSRFATVASRLFEYALKEEMKPNPVKEFNDEHHSAYWFEIVNTTWTQTRIYVFIGEHRNLVEMMSTMESLKMFDSGEYLVIYIDLETYNSRVAMKYLWRLNDFGSVSHCRNLTHYTAQIARSLLVVAPSPVAYSYREFSNAVTAFNSKPPFNFMNSLLGPKYRKFVSIYAANLYDSVFIYAKALDALWLKSNGTENIQELARDGRAIFKSIIKMKSYESISGAGISIDENGDSGGNYTVIAYTEQLFESGHFTCDYGMFPVANFHQSDAISSLPEIQFFSGKKIEWDLPPADSPKCGFHYEHCQTAGTIWRVRIIAAFLAIIFLLLLSTCLFLRYKRIQKIPRLTSEEIREFKHGNKSEYSSELEHFTYNQPYDNSFEIESHAFLVDHDAILGQGQFGIVYKGTMKVGNTLEPVAFKTVKCEKGTTNLKSLLSELKLMIYIGQHPNILRLMGAYTRKLNRGIAYVGLEFCEHGSLERLLRNNQHLHTAATTGNLEEFAEEVKEAPILVTPLMQNQWSSQIAKGMDYLSAKKIVHADLATRNVLVTSDLSVRISDFGLSRRMENYENYLKTGEEPLPWRWMAPESLEFRVFATASDVWSFGVALWEIYSMGSIPYGAKSWTTNFVRELEAGERLSRPVHATEEIYEQMKRCWAGDALQRPTFKDLAIFFQNGVYRENNIVYLDVRTLVLSKTV